MQGRLACSAWLGLLLWAAAAVAAQAAWAERPKITITAPAEAVGDGATPIELLVTVTPAEAVAKVQGLTLNTNVGTVGRAAPASAPNQVRFSFTPPRVPAAVTAQLSAVATVGRRKLRAKASLNIKAKIEPPGRQQSAGELGLSGPDHMVLSVHASAPIRVKEPGKVRLVTNSGEITATADGFLYAPPVDIKFPHVAIVAAITADGSAADFLAIPLYGAATVGIRSEPNAEVTLEVGLLKSGPFRTDRRGRARAPILVSPGVVAAKTSVRDSLGNTNTGTLPLGPPPFSRILSVCPGTTGPARTFVVTLEGKPDASAVIQSSTTGATLSDFKASTAGVYVANVLTAKDDSMTLVAAIPGDKKSRSECTGSPPAEMPTEITAVVSSGKFKAGGAPVTIDVTASYPGILRPLPLELSFSGDKGEVGEPERTSPTRYLVKWSPPGAFNGKTKAEIGVAVAGTKLATAASVKLEPGPAAKLSFVTKPKSIKADGASSATVTVRAVDGFGNPTSDAQLRGSIAGAALAFTTSGLGVFSATALVRQTAGGSKTIEVRDERTASTSLTARVRVLQSRGRLRMAVLGGYVTNFHKVRGLGGMLAADFMVPILGSERLSVGGSIGASSGKSTASPPGEMSVTTSVASLPVLARVNVWHPVSRFVVYGGASLGAIPARVTLESADTGKVTTKDAPLAVGGQLGADMKLGPGRIALELCYLSGSADGDVVEDGNLGGLSTSLGYRIDLF